MITDAGIILLLKTEIAASPSASAWAKQHGFSRSFISDVLAGTRNVTTRLALALGYEPVQKWQKAKEIDR